VALRDGGAARSQAPAVARRIRGHRVGRYVQSNLVAGGDGTLAIDSGARGRNRPAVVRWRKGDRCSPSTVLWWPSGCSSSRLRCAPWSTTGTRWTFCSGVRAAGAACGGPGRTPARNWCCTVRRRHATSNIGRQRRLRPAARDLLASGALRSTARVVLSGGACSVGGVGGRIRMPARVPRRGRHLRNAVDASVHRCARAAHSRGRGPGART